MKWSLFTAFNNSVYSVLSRGQVWEDDDVRTKDMSPVYRNSAQSSIIFMPTKNAVVQSTGAEQSLVGLTQGLAVGLLNAKLGFSVQGLGFSRIVSLVPGLPSNAL